MRFSTDRFDEANGPKRVRRTRRQIFRDVLAFAIAQNASLRFGRADESDHADMAIDASTALIFSAQAPLQPAEGLKDAQAVWCHVPSPSEQRVLLYFHGHNGYVTVDAQGRSRVPDWAASDTTARAGASAKQAAPLVYGLDRLGGRLKKKEPTVLVPEVSTLAKGSFWAKEPTGQYTDPARLGSLVADCRKHLASLPRPGGDRYLAAEFEKTPVERVYLCGHSGAGIPLEEAATSSLILPGTGVPTDLWLFDCTYWSKVAGFVRFCERWKAVDRLAGARADASRFVCIYRPKTQTEEVADALRTAIAGRLGVDAGTLVKDHSRANFETVVRPALVGSGVVFVRTELSHDEIPGYFIPALIETAGS